MNSAKGSRSILGLHKLPARYAYLIMPLLLSVFMTCIVSLISTLHNVGMIDGLLRLWLRAWGLSWLIAFPLLLLLLPVVRNITHMLVETTEASQRVDAR